MPSPILSESTREAVQQLQQRMQQIEGARARSGEPPVSTGCAGLDKLLPAGGLQRGTLWECFPERQSQQGSGMGTLAMLLAKAAAAGGGAVVAVDRERTFYPPAAAALGVPWEQLLVVRPSNAQDELWAIDQALRCPGVAAVWAPLNRLGAHDFRRLQLAAESGSAVVLLLRPAQARNRPSWAHIQLSVGSSRSRETSGNSGTLTSSATRCLQVTVIRIRGGKLNATANSILVEIDEATGQLRQASSHHATHSLHPSPAVADPTPNRGTA